MIQTPTLHFNAKWDTVVEEEQSLALIKACKKMEAHPGAHFVPYQGSYIKEADVKRYCV